MKRITRKTCDAFINGRDVTCGNTHVHHNNNGRTSRMFLHGNKIAERRDQNVRVSLAGFPTATTRERINGLLELLHVNRRVDYVEHAYFLRNTLNQERREISAHQWLDL